MKAFLLIVAILLPTVASMDVYEALRSDIYPMVPSVKCPCIKKCFDPVIKIISTYFTMRDLPKITKDICKNQLQSLACPLGNYNFNCARNPKLYTNAAIYVRNRCKYMDRIYGMVEKCYAPNIDSVMQKCESKCSSTVNDFQRTGFEEYRNCPYRQNLTYLADYAEGICEKQRCLLPCISTEMNAVCRFGGSYAVIALMERFTASLYISTYSSHIMYGTLRKLDSRCHYLFDYDLMRRIRRGDFSAFENTKLPVERNYKDYLF